MEDSEGIVLVYSSDIWLKVRVMVVNTTFNNISVISWQSVLLVKESEVPAEYN
jgi:hypothetical protein